jgi:hypothetical protein
VVQAPRRRLLRALRRQCLQLIETIKEDNVILLFKVKFSDDTYTLGFYDTTNEVYYDMWRDSSHSEVTTKPLENIVLQNYLNLTCSLTIEERRSMIFFVDDDDKPFFENAPLVKYEYRQKSTSEGKPSYIYKLFDKSKYFGELKNVAPFLRKLPLGANASDEAIQMAKRLGIDLPSGYTLVRGFKRVFYTK